MLGSTLGGTLASISQCYALFLSVWTTIGPAPGKRRNQRSVYLISMIHVIELVHAIQNIEGIKELSEKERQNVAHPDSVYSLANLVTYALYPPLYLAGPIITFNDFMWQVRLPCFIYFQALFFLYILS